MPDIQEILTKHVELEISCVDRIYLCGFVPILQTPGQLVQFLRRQPAKTLFR